MRRRRGSRLLLAGVAWWASACVVAGAIDLASDAKLRASQEAAADGDLATAADDARAGRSIQPWAAAPRLQLALVQEGSDSGRGNRSIDEAIERSNEDWRIWLVATRLRAKAGDEAGARGRCAARGQLVPPVARPAGAGRLEQR